MTEIQAKAVNTIRVISAEAISNANSGHSGIALGAAPIMYAVYNSMKIDTQHPDFFNRDRFVMSAGHGSALLYTTLHFAGFDVRMEDLKQFRRLGSKTAGHPELHTPGVDCATGPLGQGVAMSVGLALAEKKLAAAYNRKGHEIIDHHTFCLAGDGCLMEGISYEACNLAGLWRLSKLIMLYDSNNVTLDGMRESADGEDIVKRFEAMRWSVLTVDDGNDAAAIMDAIERAKTSKDAPTLIIVKTEIGHGAKNAGTSKAHGQVLTRDEIRNLRDQWGLTGDFFGIDGDVKKHFAAGSFKHLNQQKSWQSDLAKYKKEYPQEHKNLCKFFNSNLSTSDDTQLVVTAEGRDMATSRSEELSNLSLMPKPVGLMATRDAGHIALNQIARQSPRLFGANADISSTTKAFIQGGGLFSESNPNGTDIGCGVREFSMSAICNGLALHGFTPYCSTFLAFSDYCKAAIRLTALMNLPVSYIFSHDGIGNAPDGPTHQATEHIAALRLIPNMTVFRPADDTETAAAYKWVFEHQVPAAIILGRGGVPSLKGGLGADKIDRGVNRGGYVVSESAGAANAVLLATGGEVSLCIAAQSLLEKAGIGVRVVSMPSCELFDAQDAKYISSVLDSRLPIIAVEMGSGDAWYKYIGSSGTVIDFDRFGSSGTQEEVMDELGFTPEKIAKVVLSLIKKS